MTPEMVKAMLGAWIKHSLEPMLRAALEASIPADLICGSLVGACASVARRAGWTKEQLVELVASHWDRAEKSAREAPLAD